MHSEIAIPDSTAVRVALWRALHVQIDPPPHVFVDEIGLKLAAPAEDWRNRPDMDVQTTKAFRASIVARARFIEDLVVEQANAGVNQFVLLGAGLNTFAQRRPVIASRMQIFELDRPASQAWKQQRLLELGYGLPKWLHFVPVDFETGEDQWSRLTSAGLDASRPAIVAAAGLSMYLTRNAIVAILNGVAALAQGSMLVMTFLQPLEHAEPGSQSSVRMAEKGAKAGKTPFISFFTPEQMLAMAREAGLKGASHVSAADLGHRYFSDRTDNLRPPVNSEEILVATT